MLVFSIAAAPLQSQAATAQAGDLIKGSLSSVYYVGIDGKRYVFPTEKVYFTWYSDFSSVVTVTDAELATYPIGGNVTYRPGTKMVKIMTDPRVYAVDAGGTLRWVETEDAATGIYGSDWNTKIDDISDAYFVNYNLGSSISTPSQFDPIAVRDAAASISTDKDLTAPEPEPVPEPTPEPTHTGTLSASQETATVNTAIDLFASANFSGSVSRVQLYWNDVLVKECTYAPCGTSVNMPSSSDASTAVALFSWITGETATSTKTVTLDTTGQSSVHATVTRPEIRSGDTVEIFAEVEESIATKFLDIYIDGNLVRGCIDQRICQYADIDSSPAGTVHEVYAIAHDTLGNMYQSASTEYRVVENPHPYTVISIGKTFMYAGESNEATVQASDDDGIEYTQIWFNDALVKECASSLCTSNVGPITTPGSYTITGKARDLTGLETTVASESFLVQ